MKLKLHTKNIRNNADIRRAMKNFQHEITKERTFFGLPLTYAKMEQSPAACWEKFVIGGNKYHQTRTVEIARVERIHWVFTILDILYKINYDHTKYDNVYIMQNPNNEFRIEIMIDNYSYHLFFLKTTSGGIKRYCLLTAFYKRKTDI